MTNSTMDYLHHPETNLIIENALREDIGSGDHTTLSTIPADSVSSAKALIKDEGILAGVEIARLVFQKLDPEMNFIPLKSDGDAVTKGDIAFRIEGKVHAILSGERLALNVMQRMSGIATFTHRLVKMLEGTKCKLLDTRKTTPGFRHFEKWAVLIGGGVNHRIGLYDMILIKDNHIDYAGGIEAALLAAQKYVREKNPGLKIEIETRNLEEVKQVVAIGGIQRILLDNMDADTMKKAVAIVDGKFETEGSGNINETTLRSKAETGVDYLSMGALTHSYKSLDISLDAG